MKKAKNALIWAALILLMLCTPVQAQGSKAGRASDGSMAKLFFFDEHGQEYRNLRKTVKKKTDIYLPQLPGVEGYKNLGWSLKAGGSVQYKAGGKIKAWKTLKFYAVRRENRNPCTISFLVKGEEADEYYEIQHMTAEKKTLIELPSVKNPSGKTFLGWSRSPFTEDHPDFKEGDMLQVDGDMILYAVMFDRSKEKNITKRSLNKVNTKKYAKVIFVGDSRTNAMKMALKDEFGKKEPKNVSFVAKNGQGLKWFKSKGIRLLMKEISSAGGKPTAVIINLGVNDLKHDRDDMYFSGEKVAQKYIRYMKQLAEKLKGRNCRLFYMSVNPVNGTIQKSRQEKDIEIFNCALKKGLKGKFRFIDTNTWLSESGFSTGRLYRKKDDGLHYQARTYKRIYNYCIKAVNAAA